MEHVVRKNINRGYMKLVVLQDAKALYVMTCKMFRAFPYELKRVASQQINVKKADGKTVSLFAKATLHTVRHPLDPLFHYSNIP